jgi:hypothetical protein
LVLNLKGWAKAGSAQAFSASGYLLVLLGCTGEKNIKVTLGLVAAYAERIYLCRMLLTNYDKMMMGNIALLIMFRIGDRLHACALVGIF